MLSGKRGMAARYDAVSRGYDRLYGEEQASKHDLVSEWLIDVKGSVLDCGCGTGVLLEHVSTRVREAVGVDVSRGMLEVAKRRVRGAVSLLLADFDHPPFREEVFDVIISVTSLPSTLFAPGVIGRWLRIVKPGGWIILSLLKKGVSREEVLGFLRGEGLKVVEVLDLDQVKDYFVVVEKEGEGDEPP